MCKAFSTIAAALALLSIVTGVERTFYDTPQTFARYPAWDMTETGVIRFKFQTIKQNSLLLYFDGADSSQDFVKVQIVNGKIVCQTNFGSGKRDVDIGYNLADGNWHTLQLSFRRGVLDVILDDSRNKELNLPSSDEDENKNILNVKSPIFIGGVKSNTPNLVQPYVPVEPQFAGCIKDFEFTRFDGSMGQPLVKEEHGTKEGCSSSACDDQNTLSSCKNGGSCIAQSNGYFCDCNVTGYTGDKCTIGKLFFNSLLLKLNGGPGKCILYFYYVHLEILTGLGGMGENDLMGPPFWSNTNISPFITAPHYYDVHYALQC